MALDFLAGCAGGAAGVIVGHPLDTVKVRLQTQSPDNIKYRGTFHCLSTIARQESIAGLYKGIASPLCGVAAVNAVIFGVYGLLRPLVSGHPGNDALWAHFAAGSASGCVQSVIASPMELVKTRMQLDESTATRKPGTWDVLKGIYQKEGGLRRGVMKGWSITAVREIPAFGAYFATYEALTRNREVSTFTMLMAGGSAGVVSWVLCFPADVIKTRLQSDNRGRYAGAIDCFRKTYTAEGYKAFSRGLTSTVIRAFPTNAATFTVVTWIMRLAEEKHDDLQNSHQELENLLKEWDSARLQQKLFNYDILHVNGTQQRQYDFLSLASQCVIPQRNNSDYLNIFPISDDESSNETKGNGKSSLSSLIKENLLCSSENVDTVTTTTATTEKSMVDNAIIASKESKHSPDNVTDCEHPLQPPVMNSHKLQCQNQCNHQATAQNSQTNSAYQSKNMKIDSQEKDRSHETSTLPVDLKAAAVNVEDSCANDTTNTNSNTKNHTNNDEESTLSGLMKAWMKDNWTPFHICKCIGDHCVCYI